MTVSIASATPTDFHAEAISSSRIQCQFTLPPGIDLTGTIHWQRCDSDPETTTPNWTDLAEQTILP